MKKLFYSLTITTILVFAFTLNVEAATYHADELEVGQWLDQGDIVDFGSGNYDGQTYNRVLTSKEWAICP